MVVYIRKRLNISVCIPSGAEAEGGGVGCMVSRQPSLTCRTSPPPYVQFLATPLLGERFSSPSGSGRSPAAKRYLVNFRLKNLATSSNDLQELFGK